MGRSEWSLLALVLGLAAGCGEVPSATSDGGNVEEDGGGGTCDPACGANATCSGTTCACDDGYVGDGITCEDVNECETLTNGGCDVHADCTNTAGGRTCACFNGYAGDGVTCAQIWERVGMLAGIDLNPDGLGAKATAVGNIIFFAPTVSSSSSSWFRSFNTSPTARSFSAELALPPSMSGKTDFFDDGLSNPLVADPNYVYLFGDWGYRYDLRNDRWDPYSVYASPYRRGNAAIAYEQTYNTLLFIGGDGDSTEGNRNAVRINQLNGSPYWGFDSYTVPGTEPPSKARAWAPSTMIFMFVAGGTSYGGKALFSYNYGTPDQPWTRLPDAQANLSAPTGMGEYNENVDGENRFWIWVSTSDTLYFFAPDGGTNGTWRGAGVPAPVGMVTAVSSSQGVYALVKNNGNLEIYELRSLGATVPLGQ